MTRFSSLEQLADRDDVLEVTISNAPAAPWTAAITTFETGPENERGGMTGTGRGHARTPDVAVAVAAINWQPAHWQPAHECEQQITTD